MTLKDGVEETQKDHDDDDVMKHKVKHTKNKRKSVKIQTATTKASNILTRSKPFKVLVTKTFKACDTSHTGDISKSELYVGLLMVHVKLAKFCGPAATFPPSRDVSDEMFEAADIDQSNGIDHEEFESIIVILCAHILSRMLVYYSILLVFVPWLARHVIDQGHTRGYLPANNTYWDMATSQTINLSLFYIVVPLVWDWLDTKSTQTISNRTTATKKNNQLAAATTKSNDDDDDNDEDEDKNETKEEKKNK